MTEQPIKTAPKDGRIIVAIEHTSSKYGFCHCLWKDGEWIEIIHKTVQHPTHWKPYK
jgi:hypothetical protein